jgi:hypothetical protein
LIFYFAFGGSLLLKGIPTGARDFLFTKVLALRLTQPAIQWVQAVLSQALKQLGHKADQSPPSRDHG